MISLSYPVMVIAVLGLGRESSLLRAMCNIVVLKIATSYF